MYFHALKPGDDGWALLVAGLGGSRLFAASSRLFITPVLAAAGVVCTIGDWSPDMNNYRYMIREVDVVLNVHVNADIRYPLGELL